MNSLLYPNVNEPKKKSIFYVTLEKGKRIGSAGRQTVCLMNQISDRNVAVREVGRRRPLVDGAHAVERLEGIFQGAAGHWWAHVRQCRLLY